MTGRDKTKVELSAEEMKLIIMSMSSSWFGPRDEKVAYELIQRLKSQITGV